MTAGSAATGLSIAGCNEIDITLEVPGMAWDDHAAKAVMVSELGELASGVPAARPQPKELAADAGEGEAVAVAPPAQGADGATAEPAAATPAEEADPQPTPGAAAPPSSKAAEPAAEAAAEPAAEAEAALRPPTGMTAVSALPKARTPVVKMTVASAQVRTRPGTHGALMSLRRVAFAGRTRHV